MKSKVIKVFAAVAAALALVTLTGCGASCARFQKTWDSNMDGGLNREIVVYSATGDEVWRFSGKFDVEYSSGRILFDDENNKRHTIYFENGTVIINEI